MNSYSLADAKARLSELIDKVAAGETIEITRRGRPAARLVPPVRRLKKVDVERLEKLTAGRDLVDQFRKPRLGVGQTVAVHLRLVTSFMTI